MISVQYIAGLDGRSSDALAYEHSSLIDTVAKRLSQGLAKSSQVIGFVLALSVNFQKKNHLFWNEFYNNRHN